MKTVPTTMPTRPTANPRAQTTVSVSSDIGVAISGSVKMRLWKSEYRLWFTYTYMGWSGRDGFGSRRTQGTMVREESKVYYSKPLKYGKDEIHSSGLDRERRCRGRWSSYIPQCFRSGSSRAQCSTLQS